MTEQETTWGLVVESDQVYSARNGLWYEVLSTRHAASGVLASIRTGNGVSRLPPQPVDKPVRVRRGPTGKAVDVFIEIFTSG